MNPLYIVLFIAVIGGLSALINALRAKRTDDNEDFEKQEAARERIQHKCGAGETIEILCPAAYDYSKYYAVTEKRLYIEGSSFATVPFDKISDIKFQTASGSKTNSIASAAIAKIITIDGNRYTLSRYSGRFDDLLIYISGKRHY